MFRATVVSYADLPDDVNRESFEARGFDMYCDDYPVVQMGGKTTGNMECPYCGRDLLLLIWEHWSGTGSEHFELICPKCGNKDVVVARLSFDIHKHEE